MELVLVDVPEAEKYYTQAELGIEDVCGYGSNVDKNKFTNVKYFVYWYGYGCYDGAGEGVFVLNDGRVSQLYNLGHCSCYGPSDSVGMFDESKESWRTLTDILNSEDVLDNRPCDEILNKLKELVS